MLNPPLRSSDAWVSFFPPNPQARLRLFCFPYAGGTIASFRTWAEGLPQAVEVCAMSLPGRGSRLKEAPFTQIEPLIEALAQAIMPYLDRPFAFFGHSLGALVSFELTRWLRSTNSQRMPMQIFLSGRWAADRSNQVLPSYNAPEPEFLARMDRLGGIPAEVLAEKELLDLLLPTLRADLAVNETYVYKAEPPLSCPISVFGGLHDPIVHRNELMLWQSQTTASCIVRMLPGDHFFFNTAQPLLLAMLTQELRYLLSSDDHWYCSA